MPHYPLLMGLLTFALLLGSLIASLYVQDHSHSRSPRAARAAWFLLGLGLLMAVAVGVIKGKKDHVPVLIWIAELVALGLGGIYLLWGAVNNSYQKLLKFISKDCEGEVPPVKIDIRKAKKDIIQAYKAVPRINVPLFVSGMMLTTSGLMGLILQPPRVKKNLIKNLGDNENAIQFLHWLVEPTNAIGLIIVGICLCLPLVRAIGQALQQLQKPPRRLG